MGDSDCGLFALAFITSICNGEDPVKQIYDQSAMRDHLVRKRTDYPFPFLHWQEACHNHQDYSPSLLPLSDD